MGEFHVEIIDRSVAFGVIIDGKILGSIVSGQFFISDPETQSRVLMHTFHAPAGSDDWTFVSSFPATDEMLDAFENGNVMVTVFTNSMASPESPGLRGLLNREQQVEFIISKVRRNLEDEEDEKSSAKGKTKGLGKGTGKSKGKSSKLGKSGKNSTITKRAPKIARFWAPT